jgi:hypothetical protein
MSCNPELFDQGFGGNSFKDLFRELRRWDVGGHVVHLASRSASPLSVK